MKFSDKFLKLMGISLDTIDMESVEELACSLSAFGARLFIVGVGGSAANASHAASDFRTLARIEAYAFDNVANITALTNDQGWELVYANWLRDSGLCDSDYVLFLSVGGGSQTISRGLVLAANFARSVGAYVGCIVGRDGGELRKLAQTTVLIPAHPDYVTPITESMQSVILHLLVTHPILAKRTPKWEGVSHAACH